MVDLSSAKAKLQRAKLHADQAGLIAKNIIGSQLYDVVLGKDKRKRLVAKIANLKEMPPEFALAVGDAAHNMRSALDHLAFAFARNPTVDEERRIQFPLATTSRRWRQGRKKNLSTVPRKICALIDRFQPYHRRKGKNNELLGQLQEIDNWDKHRRLFMISTHIKRGELRVNVVVGHAEAANQPVRSGLIREGTVLARFSIRNASTDAKVNITGKTIAIPVFSKRMPKRIARLSVLNRLQRIREFIQFSVLPEFEKY